MSKPTKTLGGRLPLADPAALMPRWAKQLILWIAQHAWVSAAHVCDVGTFGQVGLIS
jgi:hypothetical protein